MSKALELTVYPSERQCACCEPIYTLPTGEVVTSYNADSAARQKRFTDPELAAEWWLLLWNAFPFMKDGKPNTRGAQERAAAMRRFVELPDAADTDYE